MPHKLLERQYQLQAQRRHEVLQKQDFYRETARYFERESSLAKQFTSWSAQNAKNYDYWLKKSQRVQKLNERREKLKKMMQDEEDEYQRELHDQQRARSHRQTTDSMSLDQLRQNLMERRAEQDLYLPSTCRKLQSLGLNSNTDDYKKSSSSGSSTSHKHVTYSDDETSEKDNHHFSKNSPQKHSMQSNHETTENSKSTNLFHESTDPSTNPSGNRRFAAQHVCRSLENTNLRVEEVNKHRSSSPDVSPNNDDQCSEESFKEAEDTPSERNMASPRNSEPEIEAKLTSPRHSSNEPEIHREHAVKPDNWIAAAGKSTNSDINAPQGLEMPSHGRTHFMDNEPGDHASQTHTENWRAAAGKTSNNDVTTEGTYDEDCCASINETNNEPIHNFNNLDDNPNLFKRGSSLRKDTDCGNVDMSVQMYRFLKHDELKRKILELCNREHAFVVKRSWDEALRLREMRNELILLKNKNLFENNDLNINEDTRRQGLEIIEAREKLNENRVKISNSLLYSDEARDLWQKWSHEDDEIAESENNITRNLLLSEIEEEWRELALRDRNRISQLYDRVMTKSDLQNENKLAAVIREANNRQKQYMNEIAM